MNDSPGSQTPLPQRKFSRLVGLTGAIAGTMVTVAGLAVVCYCAYLSWQKVNTATPGGDDPGDVMPFIESIHSTMMMAVGVTLGGLVVLGFSLMLLPGKKR
jgi:hypothetical protein